MSSQRMIFSMRRPTATRALTKKNKEVSSVARRAAWVGGVIVRGSCSRSGRPSGKVVAGSVWVGNTGPLSRWSWSANPVSCWREGHLNVERQESGFCKNKTTTLSQDYFPSLESIAGWRVLWNPCLVLLKELDLSLGELHWPLLRKQKYEVNKKQI